MSRREWAGSSADSNLPPDLLALFPGRRACFSSWDGWSCTRLPGHTGRHAAGNGRVILAVWE